jgi:hypothetical protein
VFSHALSFSLGWAAGIVIYVAMMLLNVFVMFWELSGRSVT